MQVQPYLFFGGRCEEAADFYRAAAGAEVTLLMRFKEAPPADGGGCMVQPGFENKIMHMSLRFGDTTVLASDGAGPGPAKFEGFSLSLSPSSAAEADKLFATLSDGGQVQMPLAKTFFASRFGVLVDRFGVSWMVVVL